VNTTSINTSGSGDTITSEVQFRDTGVILNVTPRINPGGLVFLDVSQNISTPTGGADSNGNVSISQREISTKVAVDSGQTVLLGGLISETQVKSRQGVPLLSDIPILGHLFSSNSTDTIKTEIIVSIKPTVINSKGEFDALTEEYRRRFKHINPIIDNQATQKDSKLNQRSTQ
jgi:general secretion pathway protein D